VLLLITPGGYIPRLDKLGRAKPGQTGPGQDESGQIINIARTNQYRSGQGQPEKDRNYRNL
jgi:hypothetical protein